MKNTKKHKFYLIAPLLPLYLNDRFMADKDTIGIVLSGYVVATLMIDSYEINSYLCMTYLQLVRLWKICIRYRSPSIRIIPQNICRKCLTP